MLGAAPWIDHLLERNSRPIESYSHIGHRHPILLSNTEFAKRVGLAERGDDCSMEIGQALFHDRVIYCRPARLESGECA